MKKIVSVVMALALSMSLFTACGNNEGAEASYDVNEVVTKITEKVPVAMAGDLDEETLTILLGIDMADVKSFAGKISMVNNSSDRLILIEAVDGKVDAVKTALEAFKDATAASQEMYLEHEYQKALNGRLIVKGNYVLLAIMGDSVVIMDNGVEEAYKPVDEAIEAAFN